MGIAPPHPHEGFVNTLLPRMRRGFSFGILFLPAFQIFFETDSDRLAVAFPPADGLFIYLAGSANFAENALDIGNSEY